MPLSEDEQRILSEIESHLYESDPELAREVAETTVYTHAFRNIKWAALGLLVGIVIMVWLLSVSFLLSFGGFLVMLVSAPVPRAQRPPGGPGRAGPDDPVDAGWGIPPRRRRSRIPDAGTLRPRRSQRQLSPGRGPRLPARSAEER